MATTVTQNPLNEFNSYSYHHFLVLVSSTAVADTLADTETFFRFVNGEQQVAGAYVMVNPLVSNRFVIQEAEWTNLISTNAADYGSNLWTGGTLKIIEPRGMSFLNELYDAVRNLNTTVNCGLWVLKTVFIGDTGVGENVVQRYQYINSVRPTTIKVSDIGVSFDETGGQYTFEFIMADAGAGAYGNVDGAAFNSNTTVNFSDAKASSAGVTLEAAFAKLEQHVNDTYMREYTRLQKQMESQPDLPPFDKIKIHIQIAESLKRPEYIVMNSKGQGMGRDGTTPSITLAPGTPLSDAIQEVLKSCPALMDEVTGNDNSKKRVFPVITTVQTNEPGSDYREEYFFTVLSRAAPTIADADDDQEALDQAIEAGNYLEYDYLYTGQNIDVLGFDMKFNTGIVFFNAILSMSSTRDDRTEAIASKVLTSKSNMLKMGAKGQGQVFYNSTLNDPDNSDKASPNNAMLYDQMFKQQTLVDNIMVNLRIRGNPRLLNDVMPSKYLIDKARMDIKIDGEGLMQSWASQPARCKVNVRMPKNGDYDTIEQFWYNGTYRVMSVKNIFAGGVFEQELEMITEVDGAFNRTSEKPAQAIDKKPVFTEIVGEPSEIEKRIRAFMQMIRRCEGTASENGYYIMFNNVPITNGLVDHPRHVVKTASYSSSAAGAYQILTKTWDGLIGAHKDLQDFQPPTQDKACYYLLNNRGALGAIRANRIEAAIQLCNKEWASLPGSPYGQPHRSMSEAVAIYLEYLARENEGQTTLHIPVGELS